MSKKGTVARYRKTPKKQKDTSVEGAKKATVTTSAGECPVVAREREYEELKSRLAFSIQNNMNTAIYLTGMPGSGKTHTVTVLLDSINLPTVYLNCSYLKTNSRLYQDLAATLFQECEKHRREKADNEDASRQRIRLREKKQTAFPNPPGSIQWLRKHLLECSVFHIVVIDEVDFLIARNEAPLYNIFELISNEDVKLVVICISNTLTGLSRRMESRIGRNRIDFKPYTSADLKMILKKSPCQTKKIDGRVADLVTKRVASVTGDIRRVHAILEQSEGRSVKDVNNLVTSMESNLLNTFVLALTFYHKLIIFLNMGGKNNIHLWFDDFKSFCSIKSIEKLDFVQFLDHVYDLERFGIFSVSGPNISGEYLRDEIKIALSKDKSISGYIRELEQKSVSED